MSDMRHKQQKDENFPVASFLLGKENRKIVTAYYNFARYGDDIADNPDLSEAEKTKRLENWNRLYTGKQSAKRKLIKLPNRCEKPS